MQISTPIVDFVRRYAEQRIARFHMPGHKGQPYLGCEPWDITEIKGADALYEADGIIRESERNAAMLFDTGATFYSAEGSSLCIRTMLHLSVMHKNAGCSEKIIAARNVHHTFIAAATLLDLSVDWLPQEPGDSLCSCTVAPELLEATLSAQPQAPAAVYITSPDYLGNMAPIESLSEICHRYGTRLVVDQAHGAYLHFLPESLHAIHRGADLCCDSAHKTLPVLTGGAYLHLSSAAAAVMQDSVKHAMLLFGSTSPSYLILQSLDLCNAYLAGDYPARLSDTVQTIDRVKTALREQGWEVLSGDPLRLTLRAPQGMTGYDIAEQLRRQNAECEYADPEFTVLMLTPENTKEEITALPILLGQNTQPLRPHTTIRMPQCERVCSIREASLSCKKQSIPTSEAVGKICGASAVSCPPCIPIVVTGERISEEAAALMLQYGIDTVSVLV